MLSIMRMGTTVPAGMAFTTSRAANVAGAINNAHIAITLIDCMCFINPSLSHTDNYCSRALNSIFADTAVDFWGESESSTKISRNSFKVVAGSILLILGAQASDKLPTRQASDDKPATLTPKHGRYIVCLKFTNTSGTGGGEDGSNTISVIRCPGGFRFGVHERLGTGNRSDQRHGSRSERSSATGSGSDGHTN